MVSQVSKPNESADIFYPDSDRQPMARNTEQYRWILIIQQNLDVLLPEAFVAGDLFWYPIEGRPDISVAPDVMVALGRPKGKRLSYKQWQEDSVAPQVVFEILSPSNTRKEMEQKLLFFNRHGVDEYYLYDTESKETSGFLRSEFGLDHIADMSGWVSPLLNIQFDTSGDELVLQRPDGEPFVSFEEATQKAEAATQKAETAEQKAAKLAAKLKAMGIAPEQV